MIIWVFDLNLRKGKEWNQNHTFYTRIWDRAYLANPPKAHAVAQNGEIVMKMEICGLKEV
jgi:hypothetical protein